MSLRAHHFERWCQAGAWAMCKECFSLQTRDCVPSTFDEAPDPYINKGQCWRCNSRRNHAVPQHADVPGPLRGLTQKAAEALSPLEINAGAEVRSRSSAGYRVHARMMTFSWHAESVEGYIERALQGVDKQQAWAAYEYLRDNNPAYSEFVDEHEAFLWEYPNPTDKQRMRWLRFIEREGVECALWPHLFWQKDLCFTYERATDPRQVRRERRTRRRLATVEERIHFDPYAPYSEDEEEADGAADVLHSIRRKFQAMALGPIIDYGSSYEILHFVYDLVLWTTIGARKNLAGNVPMRIMMKDANGGRG